MEYQVDYELEELVPIVAKLAEKYTGIDSSSITYEKANQLMEAVIYCIHENDMDMIQDEDLSNLEDKTETNNVDEADLKRSAYKANREIRQLERSNAEEAYKTGKNLVKQKVKRALELYHELLPEFDSYGNYYLDQTIKKGMPEFFKWYDVDFEPQNTLLTLDYPVLRELCNLEGIDRIYEYLRCIQLEQRFLGKMKREFVIQCLVKYNSSYKNMVDNLCPAVLMALEERKMQGIVTGQVLTSYETYYEGDEEMIRYLMPAVKEIIIRNSQFVVKGDIS